MPVLQQFQATQVEAILAAVKQDGACIAHNVLTDALCADLIDDFSPYLAAMDWGEDELGYRNEFYGAQTKRLHGLFGKSSRMVEVLMHQLFLDLAKRLFIDTGMSNDGRLSNAELMVLRHGQGNQMFHADAGSWRWVQQREAGEILISANCALTEFTASNGATRVVPGSHRWEVGRKPTQAETCLAVMPRGAALIYSGNVLHSGGANEDAVVRAGLYLGYIVSWLRPIENQLVTNDREVVCGLSEEAQRLLDVSRGGFTVYA